MLRADVVEPTRARTRAVEGEPAASDGAATRSAPLTHLPALDGLRGIAVLAVFLFHGGVGAMAGGYLAVSTFFTLSGFLITRLLLGEVAATGRVAVGAFWERRIRRLLPAAALGVALAAMVTVLVGSASQRRAFGLDGVATIADVANWRFIVAERSYGQLFEAPSALQHAWSLAIEAQFYWVYPLLVVLVLRLVRGSRRGLGLVLAALFAASILVTRVAGFGADRIYYGSDTRAAELLAGAVLAVLVAGRRESPAASPSWVRRSRLVDGASALALAAVVAAWVVTPRDAEWLGTGGLGVYAALSAVVILGAAVPGTLVARGLAVGPLRALGRISYGVYLFHWPVLLLVAPDRVPGPVAVRLVVAGAVTLVLAVASFRWVELPVRAKTRPFAALGLGPVVATCVAVALVPTVAVAWSAPPGTDLDERRPGELVSTIGQLGSGPSGVGDGTGSSPVTTVPSAGAGERPVGLAPRPYEVPPRRLRVVVVGDSVAYELSSLLDAWGSPRIWEVASHARIGCGIVRGGYARGEMVDPQFGPECSEWTVDWPNMLAEVQPDLVVVAGGFWDAIDRRMTPDEPWQAPGDAAWDRRIRSEYDVALDVLTSTGVPVLWLDHPTVVPSATGAPVVHPDDYDPARMARLDDIQAEAVAGRPTVRVVRTRDFLDAWPGGVLDPALRPDGMHFSGPGSAPFVAWLGPELLAGYRSITASPAG